MTYPKISRQFLLLDQVIALLPQNELVGLQKKLEGLSSPVDWLGQGNGNTSSRATYLSLPCVFRTFRDEHDFFALGGLEDRLHLSRQPAKTEKTHQ